MSSGRNSTFHRDLVLPSSAVKMETSVNFYLTTWYHMPEDSMVHSHRCEDVISIKLLRCSKFTIVPITNTTKLLLWSVSYTTHHSTTMLSVSFLRDILPRIFKWIMQK